MQSEIASRTYDGPLFRFVVLSRSLIRQYEPDEPHIVISVTNPGLPGAVLPDLESRRAELRLRFHDTGDYGQPLGDLIVMQDEEANAILSFIALHALDIQTIVCQCEAGMSRSAGIAAALSRILQDEDRFFYANFAPNRWVYRMLMDAHEQRLSGK